MSKSPKTPRAKLTGAWRLFTKSLRAFRADWKTYVKILALVAVPVDVLGLFQAFSDNPNFNAFAAIAAIIMNVALVWAIVERAGGGRRLTLAEAYYDGSVAVVRFILVNVLIVFMLIPAGFASVVFLAASTSPEATTPELLLIGIPLLLIAAVSVYLLVRFGFGPFTAVREGLRPIAALRRSWRLTRRRFWPLLGRYILLGLFLLLLALPLGLIGFVLSIFKLITIGALFFEIATTLVALPVANLYLCNLYLELEPRPDPEPAA